MARLYAWDPDRDPRLACIDQAPFDDSGEDLLLFNGMLLDPGTAINLEQPAKGTLTDFLYSPTLMMYVSARALSVIQQAHTPHLGVHPVVLRNRKGRVVDEDGYFWINVKPAVRLLDEQRSVFERSIGGGIARVDSFVIREDRIPDDDLFLVEELSLPVFSEKLVREIEAKHVIGATFEDLTTMSWGV